MPVAIIALIQGIVAVTPHALRLWQELLPILQEARDPSAEEWDRLNALADAAHREVQEG